MGHSRKLLSAFLSLSSPSTRSPPTPGLSADTLTFIVTRQDFLAHDNCPHSKLSDLILAWSCRLPGSYDLLPILFLELCDLQLQTEE